MLNAHQFANECAHQFPHKLVNTGKAGVMLNEHSLPFNGKMVLMCVASLPLKGKPLECSICTACRSSASCIYFFGISLPIIGKLVKC
jgi:hypothetical protein